MGTQAEAAGEIGSSCGQLGRDGEESTCTREKLQQGRAFPFLLLLPLRPLPYLPPPLPFSLLLLLHLLQLRLQLLWGAAHLSGTGQAAPSRAGTRAERRTQRPAPRPLDAGSEYRRLGTEAGGGSELGAPWRRQKGAKVSRRLLKAPLRLLGGEGLLEIARTVRKTGDREACWGAGVGWGGGARDALAEATPKSQVLRKEGDFAFSDPRTHQGVCIPAPLGPQALI